MGDIFQGMNQKLKFRAIVGIAYMVNFGGFFCIGLSGLENYEISDTVLTQIVYLQGIVIAAVFQSRKNEIKTTTTNA